MVMLADLSETKAFLRYDDGDPDQDLIIAQAIMDISDAVLLYLKVPSEFFEESDFEESGFEIPGAVRRATMIWVGQILRDPSGVESQIFDIGYPPRVVMNLLHQLRDPAMAAGSGTANGEGTTGNIPPWWCCWQK